MQQYNNIMLYFWLLVGFFITIAITYLVITQGFRKWGIYYLMAFMSFAMYFLRKWMMKRMEKHAEYMQNKEREEQNSRS